MEKIEEPHQVIYLIFRRVTPSIINPSSTLMKQTRATWIMILSKNIPKMWQYDTRIKYLNNLLPMLLGPDEINKLPEEDINEIFIHAILNSCTKQ